MQEVVTVAAAIGTFQGARANLSAMELRSVVAQALSDLDLIEANDWACRHYWIAWWLAIRKPGDRHWMVWRHFSAAWY